MTNTASDSRPFVWPVCLNQKKLTLKNSLAAELGSVLAQRPELKVVKLADGAPDNWRFLSEQLPEGHEFIDFYHASSHLKEAFDAAHGEGTVPAQEQFEKYRHILRHDIGGVERVIRALKLSAVKTSPTKTHR